MKIVFISLLCITALSGCSSYGDLLAPAIGPDTPTFPVNSQQAPTTTDKEKEGQ